MKPNRTGTKGPARPQRERVRQREPQADAPDDRHTPDNWRATDDRPATAAPGSIARLAALTRRAAGGLAAAAVARWPAARAAPLPRLSRLASAFVGGLLMFASFPAVNWWWAAVVAA